MSYAAVLDVSSIVWDESDFTQNTEIYDSLKDSILTTFERIEIERPSILLRRDLLNLIINGFPCASIPKFYDFSSRVYSFLTKIGSDILEYDKSEVMDVDSTPEIVKPYFDASLREELQYQISEMHTNGNLTSVYFTFSYLFQADGNLRTRVGKKGDREHETIIADKGSSLSEFFGVFERVFKHNPKHHAGNALGDFVSPLSCFDNKDTSVPQALLDQAIPLGKKLYNYDEDNRVYVVFVRTIGTEYHAYDEVDINKIPPAIRKHYGKK